MKTRTLFLILLAGVITLSFTFVSVSQKATKVAADEPTAVAQAPAGGFELVDEL